MFTSTTTVNLKSSSISIRAHQQIVCRMGKLIYTNRKIQGSKLSQVVIRDITKRMPTNLNYAAALRDPVIEFDISSKSIDDESLKDISQALIAATKQSDPGRVLVLEEVSLKNNKFSMIGLVSFASVIKLSSSEIRNLDLSDNLIEIRTHDDAVAWEKFLRSFSQCNSLRRLDLSGNQLGRKGFEILSKVWVAEEGVIVCEETGQASICGLQSIPYICLANTGLDDLGSTYLSYILENHKFVHEILPLVPQAKPGSQTHQLEALNEVEGCNVLIWKPNHGVHSLGIKVLELAEVVREARTDLQDQDEVDGNLVPGISEMEFLDSHRSPIRRRSRGDSIVSIDDSFHYTSTTITSDLIRARSRIQLDVLRDGGMRQNDLWIGAFKMLHYTRVLLFGSAQIEQPTCLAAHRRVSTPIGSGTTTQPLSPAWPSLASKTPARQNRNITLRLVRTENQRRPALSSGDPNASLSTKELPNKDVTTIRATMHDSQRRRPKGVRNLTDYLSTETKEQHGSKYKCNLPAGFSERVWTKIIAYAADVESILSDNQKTSVVRWGASRASIRDLRSFRHKHESQQAYKALEGMGCLAYGI